MTRPPRYRLSDAEKDALLHEQAALIERRAAIIGARTARIAALQAELAKPRKSSRNSRTPPSQDPGGGRPGGGKAEGRSTPKTPRPSRPGVSRRLTAAPDEKIVRHAGRCACGPDVSRLKQTCRMRYDHIDIPPVLPHLTRVALQGGRCGCGPGASAPRRRTACRRARRSGRTSTRFWAICTTAITSASRGWRGSPASCSG
jgi:transposase